MSESNLSKGDLEELCRAFGVSTDGVKADLVQRLKQLSSEVGQNPNSVEETGETSLGNCDVDDQGDHVFEVNDFNIDPVAQSLKELAYQMKGKFKQPPLSNKIAEPDNPYTNTEECTNRSKRHYQEMEFDNPLGNLVLSEFKKLGNVMTNFNDRLNSVAMQYDSLCTIGTELDLAKESRSFSEVMTHIEKASALPNTQDNWLKGKDTLIEKAKALAEEKKNKRQKTTSLTENRESLFHKPNY
ncbi:20605_t:CDS:2 [Dentiscutata erythropus]|uniref:20605_t:CDS:1 n=1 Tax=Dentiscutata erythropus TaxID=1348616 RepID=A0A9N9CLT7_9GLOM|nr:20605_t:CDS:2 [Dentiscutata erythropus]